MILLNRMFIVMASRRIASCLVALSLAGAASAALAQEARIAAVDSDRILRESAPAKAAQGKLEQEFSTRDRDLQNMAQKLKSMSDSLDKNGPSLSATDRQQRQTALAQLDSDFQRKQREFREDLNQRRNEELAEQQHYDLVVQEAVYVSPRINITDQVLKALASGTAGN
jgi:outer membrane protein